MKLYKIYYRFKYILLYKILRNEKAYYAWADREITKTRLQRKRELAKGDIVLFGSSKGREK